MSTIQSRTPEKKAKKKKNNNNKKTCNIDPKIPAFRSQISSAILPPGFARNNGLSLIQIQEFFEHPNFSFQYANSSKTVLVLNQWKFYSLGSLKHEAWSCSH